MKNNHKITYKNGITNLFAETFSKNPSHHNNQQFQKVKQWALQNKLQFKSDNTEEYGPSQLGQQNTLTASL